MNTTQPGRAEILKAAANGNAEAERFLTVYAARCHLLDDLIDGPMASRAGAADISDEMIAQSEADWLIQLTSNGFFLAHKERLLTVLLLGLNAWLDSNQMDPGPARDVVKAGWHETVWAVALLTGGWQRLRVITSRNRVAAFDFEDAREAENDAKNGDPMDRITPEQFNAYVEKGAV